MKLLTAIKPTFFPTRNISSVQQKSVHEFNTSERISYAPGVCQICGSDRKKVLFTNDRYGINQKTVMCKQCALVYSDPRLTGESLNFFYQSNLYRTIYGSHANRLERYEHCKKIEINTVSGATPLTIYEDSYFFSYFAPEITKANTIVEVGAGGGWNLIPLMHLQKRCLGVEPYKKLCQQGAEHAIPMVQGDHRCVASCDLIVLRHVLEHIDNPVAFLEDLRGITRQGIAIEIPAIVNQIPSIQNAHLHYFTPETFKACCAKAGLEVTKEQYCKANDFYYAFVGKGARPYAYSYTKQRQKIMHIYKKFFLRSRLRLLKRMFIK